MKTVPLSGKKADGRVARIDDGDYELVRQYTWYVKETKPRPGNRGIGPYALAILRDDDGRRRGLLMHALLTG